MEIEGWAEVVGEMNPLAEDVMMMLEGPNLNWRKRWRERRE